ncbi:uncharacterized protein LOC115726795 [Rhodamnia argentea]|uniref:DNA-(apurinic or apyrimidinic site) lyase n=1 Tax=Rhodamnia argentea TaxID=178133 RepID=A0ABM3HH91_9MYRT|nr:uncharacterized protein LOC115726795 [Rhodamnia argentea]
MEEFDLQLCLDGSSSTFNLEKVVCNHGFFMMAPNQWIPSTKTLRRPLRLADLSSSVEEQVTRMLRLLERDEHNVNEFHKVHPEAKDKGFGRVFRSPSLFEDVVKSILLCNCQWKRTLEMAQALCALQLELSTRGSKGKKRRREKDGALPIPAETEGKEVDLGNFPSPKELANLEADYLQTECNLGYRSKYIVKLAREIEEGKRKIDEYEGVQDAASCRILIQRISGVGPFVRASILMCLGFYDEVPWDSETIKLLKHVHARERCTKKTIKRDLKEIYDKYAPFQCLAYWLDLLEFYERKFGKLSELSHTMYHTVASSTQIRESNHPPAI